MDNSDKQKIDKDTIKESKNNLEIEVKTVTDFQEVIFEVRDMFKDIIIDFDYFPLFYDKKIDYFPLTEENFKNPTRTQGFDAAVA